MQKKEYILKNGQKLTIRPSQDSDAEAIIHMLNKLGTETDFTGYKTYNYTVEQQQGFIKYYNVEDANAMFAIAEIDNQLIGDISFTRERRDKMAHSGEMGIYILKDYWQLGIGSKLMDYFINWIKTETEIKKVNLKVRVDNKSGTQLYLQKGFKFQGVEVEAFEGNDGIFYDMYSMGLLLNKSKKVVLDEI